MGPMLRTSTRQSQLGADSSTQKTIDLTQDLTRVLSIFFCGTSLTRFCTLQRVVLLWDPVNFIQVSFVGLNSPQVHIRFSQNNN